MKPRHYLVSAFFIPLALQALTLPDGTEEAYRSRMEAPENKHIKEAIDRLPLTGDTLQAMKFLYAYMPVPDMADRSPEFYLANAVEALKTRCDMPWGKSVPDREWRHFVLPVRVNNENLDMSRPEFLRQLKDRVKGMSMTEAALEVNHWCHEKATYKPSDGRTSSPLSTLSQAIGRCGEESTLAVAAMRAVGIPARQVYTPRWAHTDDNHAWVEVWTDGQWHFLGACEPEPVLDLAWFNAPASRGIMMSTNVFGAYDGPEEVLASFPLSTRINITSNYAPVREVRVRTVDPCGNPVAGADVNFCIYNYAQYFPVTSRKTDSDGYVSLLAGEGDMMIWASDGPRCGLAKAPCGQSSSEVVIDLPSEGIMDLKFDIVPPAGNPSVPEVSKEMREENNRRFAEEDAVRQAYTATFCTPDQAVAIARELGVDPDALTAVLVQSRGNHAAIADALRRMTPRQRVLAMGMLQAVTEKDRRDIPVEVIEDQVWNSPSVPTSLPEGSKPYFDFILNPRIESEGLTPWRGILAKKLLKLPEEDRSDAAALARWTAGNISVTAEGNPQNLRMSPESTFGRRASDARGRRIFFVAACRALGLPARIDEVTGKAQWLDMQGKWHDAFPECQEPGSNAETPSGTLILAFTPAGYMTDPKYYSSFSLSRIDGGEMRELEYPEEATWSNTFASGVTVDAGRYMLTTGQRLADGAVLADTKFFSIIPGQTLEVPLEIRHDDTALQVIGSLDAETPYTDTASGDEKSLLSTAGRGYYALGLISPGHEPSAHTLNDISAIASKLADTGRTIFLLFESDEAAARFDASHFKNLPANVVFGVDSSGRIRSQIVESLHLKSDENPLFVLADSFNRIVWTSQGYTIGLGETLLRHFHTLSK